MIQSANGKGGLPSMYAREQEALRAIIGGTYAQIGDAFFRALVCHLSEALHVRYAFVTECVDMPTTRARTLAFWTGRE
jgi:two-component system, sporulation sensor kinase A